MKRRFYLLVVVAVGVMLSAAAVESKKIPVPSGLEQSYPRIYLTQGERAELEKTIANEQWAQSVIEGIHGRIDGYVEQHVTDPEWMPSRLLMNWNTKYKDVYIKGIYFSHDGGEVAPVPTVKFAGCRDNTTNYATPSIEETLPYMDDERGLYLPNKTRDGAFEWVHPSKSGTTVMRMNERILALARDAAFIYWLEGDEKYAKFAFDIFDLYMQGMYYRREPIDLDHGHIQTLIGFTYFQVIHESSLKTVAETYDFLYAYLETRNGDGMADYEATMKRWTDQIIKNGVPQNNWNLHQANIILKAAMVLKDDKYYADKKGRDYYIDQILNVTTMRQWSMQKLLDYGYDSESGVWAECPGYSFGVTKDTMKFILDYYGSFNFDLLPYLPVMYKAVEVLPQYLFPNGEAIAFGDSTYGQMDATAVRYMIQIAQQTGNKEAEAKYTSLYRLLDKSADDVVGTSKPRSEITALFENKPLIIDKSYAPAKLEDYRSQTFYAPTISWHTQRMGWGKDGLMASLNASLGNHMHANGISLELYGKGVVQGADPGKGTNYLQAPYLEYYSQFPAHNTVMVDGVSSYTEMMSYHGFELNGEYPKSGAKDGYYENLTYSDVAFIEPETQSDQNRTFAIVRNGESSGYYVDIFRSKRKNEQDRFHDYYYHNLGQTMQIMDADGKEISLTEEDRIGFAGGHLYALDYMWGEKYAETSDDYQVEWKIDYPDGEEDLYMNLWMKGYEGREIYSIQSPACKGFKSDSGFPYKVSEDPYQTFIARQYGEAWKRPFVSIYEPSTSTEGRTIASIEGFDDENGDESFAGVKVTNKSGREDYILSSFGGHMAKYKDMTSDATYAVICHTSKECFEALMGNGTTLSFGATKIEADEVATVAIEVKDGVLYIDNSAPVRVTINGKRLKLDAGERRAVALSKKK